MSRRNLFIELLFLAVAVVSLLDNNVVYAGFLKADAGQIESYLKVLKDNVEEEEKGVESLRRRYEEILRKKREILEGDNSQALTEAVLPLEDLQRENVSLKAQLQGLQDKQQVQDAQEAGVLEGLLNKEKEYLARIKEYEIDQALNQEQEITASQEQEADDKEVVEPLAEKYLIDEPLSETVRAEDDHEEIRTEESLAGQEIPEPPVIEDTLEMIEDDEEGLEDESAVDDNQSLFAAPEAKKGVFGSIADKARRIDSWWQERVW